MGYRKASQLLYLILGSLLLFIGIVGIFVPLLPTTPFLILTAFCFDRGDPRFHRWLVSHKVFGPPIVEWQNKHVIRTRYKLLATAMIVFTAIFVLPSQRVPMIGKIAYSVVVSAGLVFLWTRKGSADLS
ncbi:MAG: YbaN family protein [Bdellovibrionota bacterium]